MVTALKVVDVSGQGPRWRCGNGLGCWRGCGRASRGPSVAAGGQVRGGGGRRAAAGERVEHRPGCGDRTPDKTQRLLNHASWDAAAAMSVVRRFAVAGLDQAARRPAGRDGDRGDRRDRAGKGRRSHGRRQAPVPGLRGRVANGINTVHLAYVREATGHALVGARQWMPREHIDDPVTSLLMGLPADLRFRTKGQLAIDICADAYADGVGFDFVCGDEVYGSCTAAAGVLRSPRPGIRAAGAVELHPHAGRGTKLTCAQAVSSC